MRCAALALLGALAACSGGGKPAPVEPGDGDGDGSAPVDAGVPDAADDGVGVTALKGKLSPEKITAGVTPQLRAIQACYQDQVGARRWLGGAISIKWFVDATGAIEQVQLDQSDLGAWPIEKCILQAAAAATFAAPSGGATDFSLPIEFPARSQPLWWDEDRGNATVSKHVSKLAACATADAPAPSDVLITVYVGTRGKVESIGFATAADDGLYPAWADCAHAAIASWILSDPKGKVAKLMFRYPGA